MSATNKFVCVHPECPVDWGEYKRLVLEEMENNKTFRTEQRSAISDLQISVAKLETRATMWGAAMGLVGGIITAFFGHLFGKVKLGA